MVSKVDQLAAADVAVVGQENRLARVKYATVAEFLADIREVNAEKGVKHCPICDYLAEHLDDDVIAVARHLFEHPDWGVPYLCDVILHTARMNNAEADPANGDAIAGAAQHDAAIALTRHPWGKVRPFLERLLRDERTRFVDRRAPFVLLSLFGANHPAPRTWFDRFPEARVHFPGVDFDQLPGLPDEEAA